MLFIPLVMTESNSSGRGKPKPEPSRAAAPGMPHLSRDQLRNAAELEPQIRQRALEIARSRGQADGYNDRDWELAEEEIVGITGGG